MSQPPPDRAPQPDTQSAGRAAGQMPYDDAARTANGPRE
jgi:hypothetical protein